MLGMSLRTYLTILVKTSNLSPPLSMCMLPTLRFFFTLLMLHRQQYLVETSSQKVHSANLFNYGEKDLSDITVSTILRNPKDLSDPKKVSDPAAWKYGNPVQYKIHTGYQRVLQGFIRETELVTHDKIIQDQVLSRANYLGKVLDLFVGELKGRILPPEDFRSGVLNPILQRQLRGIVDENADHVKQAVGSTLEEAAEFYLKLDPLDPRHIMMILKGLLYVTPVRLSLGYLSYACNEGQVKEISKNTALMIEFANGPPQKAGGLRPKEVEIIHAEQLEIFYQKLLML